MIKSSKSIRIENYEDKARLIVGDNVMEYRGHWTTGGPWDRFGKYNHYVVVRGDGAVRKMPAHAGEFVPGSTEDLVEVLGRYDPVGKRPPAPMTVELDPTYACTSKDCGGRCFSAHYRRLAPRAAIPGQLLQSILRDFAREGGRVVRFDGGGDPLVHPDVRNGELPELVNDLGMKSTILTSGDLLKQSDLHRIGRANCYLRISLNAATDKTRQQFHGNKVLLSDIFSILDRYIHWLDRESPGLPVGATYLLDIMNYSEVLDCARIARDIGISHFAIRRVLGPTSLRPEFSHEQLLELTDQLKEVRGLSSSQFRIFVPWRLANEPDLSPANGDFHASRCWQSTFKTVIEPDGLTGGYRAQLCGRYRGSGVGQSMQMSPLFSSDNGGGWVEQWRKSFEDYGVSRSALPKTCISCIDRGFILMIESLLEFLKDWSGEFYIFHLQSDQINNECSRTGEEAEGSGNYYWQGAESEGITGHFMDNLTGRNIQSSIYQEAGNTCKSVRIAESCNDMEPDYTPAVMESRLSASLPVSLPVLAEVTRHSHRQE